MCTRFMFTLSFLITHSLLLHFPHKLSHPLYILCYYRKHHSIPKWVVLIQFACQLLSTLFDLSHCSEQVFSTFALSLPVSIRNFLPRLCPLQSLLFLCSSLMLLSSNCFRKPIFGRLLSAFAESYRSCKCLMTHRLSSVFTCRLRHICLKGCTSSIIYYYS